MNRKQKIQYFFDYYFVKTVVAVGLLFIVCYLLWNFFRPQPESVLYVAVLDEDWEDGKQEELNEALNRLFQADGRYKRVVLDDSFHMEDGGLDKLQVYLFNRQIDVIVAEEELYQKLAGMGYYQDMEALLSDEDGKYREQYLWAAGYKETREISFEDNETSQGEQRPYGVDISDSEILTGIVKYMENPVFSIVQEAPNEKNALVFLDYLRIAE